eukprot:COSAG01_NODE_22507_length_852_cov_2.240372_1_plen_172_part_00
MALCNRFAITMALQWLCNRFAMALQWPCNRHCKRCNVCKVIVICLIKKVSILQISLLAANLSSCRIAARSVYSHFTAAFHSSFTLLGTDSSGELVLLIYSLQGPATAYQTADGFPLRRIHRPSVFNPLDSSRRIYRLSLTAPEPVLRPTGRRPRRTRCSSSLWMPRAMRRM